MDIFLHKCINSLQEAFINTTESCGALFITDGWMHFFRLQNLIHCHYKAWKSQDMTLIVFVWKKKVIYTKDDYQEIIFIFGCTIPLRYATKLHNICIEHILFNSMNYIHPMYYKTFNQTDTIKHCHLTWGVFRLTLLLQMFKVSKMSLISKDRRDIKRFVYWNKKITVTRSDHIAC